MRATLGLLALLAGACSAGPKRYVDWAYEVPEAADGWTSGRAGEHGLDEALLVEMVRGMGGQRFFGVHSIVLVHDGELILEVHDRPRRATEPHDLRSVTKSITALLVGIAVDRGLVDIDAPLPDSVSVAARPEITARHLLTMRPGVACDDRDRRSPGNEERMYRRRDWLAFWRDLPAAPDPGSHYCTAGVVALGGLLAEATGRPVPALADEVLFGPLGIPSPAWETFRGGTDTGGHLRLRPRELAKLGQLVLDRGAWRGERIVSAAWIDQMTSPRTTVDGQDYGLLVWLGQYGEQHPLWQFRGNGGQYVFVLPEHRLVAVFTGGAYNDPEAAVPFHLMGRFVLPALGVVGGSTAGGEAGP